MRQLRIFTLLALLLTTYNGIGQKNEKLYFDGHLKNAPKHYLINQPYTVKYAVSDWFKEQIKEKTLQLDLKGFSEGEGYRVIFISDDPILTKDIIEKRNTTTGQIDYKAVVKPKSDAKLVIMNQNNELTYEICIEPHLKLSRSAGLGVNATKEEAMAQNNEIIKKKSDYLKKNYVKELMNEYQDTLDAIFGKYIKTEKFYVFTVKPKKFNYDDYNGASEKFKLACSTPEINNDEILAAIEIWKKCELEYLPGKKSRISDVNIDALYLNLTQAYLVIEDYENTKIYWDKCLKLKGNRTPEGYVKRFLDQQLEHSAYYPISEKEYAPKSLVDIATLKNRNLFFNLILGYYLAETHGELRIIQDYFPLNISYLHKMETVYQIFDDIEEKLMVSYDLEGTPLTAKYSLFKDQKQKKSLYFTFNYEAEKLVSVDQNNAVKYKIKYEGDLIKEIHYRPGEKNGLVFLMDYSNPERVSIKIRYIKDGIAKDGTSKYYAIFNEKGALHRYYIDVYSNEELRYDEKGNWTGISKTNESTGVKGSIDFETILDNHGYYTSRKVNNDLSAKRNLKYFE